MRHAGVQRGHRAAAEEDVRTVERGVRREEERRGRGARRDDADDGEINVLLRVGDESIDISVGPVGERTVAELEGDAGDTLGLRRLLDTTVEDVSLRARDGGTWVELRKGIALDGRVR